MKRNAFTGICAGVGVFALVFLIKLTINRYMPSSPVFVRHVEMEILLGITSIIIATTVFHIPLSAFNVRERFSKKATFRYSRLAFGLGMLITGCIIFFGMPPIPMLKQLNMPQLIGILLMASISEELLCRGLVYGIVYKADNDASQKTKVSPAVLASAIVFSLIHFSIYITGGSYITTIAVMLYTFFLGIVCGKAREQANIGAAIIVHFAFNVGGIFAAILINIGSMILTGHLINR